MIENEWDEHQLGQRAYAEGFDDGQRGDNLNPFDEYTQTDEWKAYEKGYIQGVMSDWVGKA